MDLRTPLGLYSFAREREHLANPTCSFERQRLLTSHATSRLTLSQVLSGHRGCVNALRYEPGPPSSKNSPAPTKLLSRFPTGHRANIFSAKFMPATGDAVVLCCAGDGDVKVIDISIGASRQTLRSTYSCFRDRAKRIVTTPGDPNVFIACGEDGTVRRFDLRTPHRCTTSNRSCPAPIIDLSDHSIELNTISQSHLNTNYVAVAGADPHMYLYDVRSAKVPVSKFRPSSVKASGNITACKFSEYNGRELLGSWHNDHIYLFDISSSAAVGNFISPGSTFRHSSIRQRVKVDTAQPSPFPQPIKTDPIASLIDLFQQAALEYEVNKDYEASITHLSKVAQVLNEKKMLKSSKSQKMCAMARRNMARAYLAWGASDFDKIESSTTTTVVVKQPESPLKRKRTATTGTEDNDIDMIPNLEPDSSSPPIFIITPSKEGEAGDGYQNTNMVILQRLMNAGSEATEAMEYADSNVAPSLVLRVASSWAVYIVDPSYKEGSIEQAESDLDGIDWPVDDKLADAIVDVTNGVMNNGDAESFLNWMCDHQSKLEVPESCSISTDVRVQEINDPDGKLKHVVAAADADDDEEGADDDWDAFNDMDANEGGEGNMESSDESGSDSELMPSRRNRVAFPQTELISTYTQKYSGHINSQTVKDVNFIGHDSSLVVSGSDNGLFFIWDKKTSRILQILRGDEQVVNVVESHPYLPTVAVSGIDDTVKLFEPIYPKQASEQITTSAPSSSSTTSSTPQPTTNSSPRLSHRSMGLSHRLRTASNATTPSLTQPFTSDASTTFPGGTFASEAGLPVSSSLLQHQDAIVAESDERRNDQDGELVITRSMLRSLLSTMGRQRGSGAGSSATGGQGGGGGGDEEEEDGECPVQ
ncbi:hypothetical protein SmJEL517_g05276 [Synchytrium microbalum]|uniref:Uncharacterized protein n=1 Tax=Synchytrium microbalum TaxID=1806994 RepID=A0A507C071_9FUNG|nr:uncharacterized protein SmJEL517_g05276 [Synchytrium microbalum]TPX31366.1 hypothetical protein SmJEL517_g05276 [Synchytrium microbalum]